MKSSPIRLKQKLSPKAAAAKKKRDIEYAKSPARKRKKAQNQRIGQRSDSDLHHTKSGVTRVSIKNNRGNFGRGTKNE
jgi:dethiobiotin synthetase